MVELIAKAAVRILGIFMLLFLAVLIFGLTGMQMFGGVMRQRCYSIEGGAILDDALVCSVGEPRPGRSRDLPLPALQERDRG